MATSQQTSLTPRQAARLTYEVFGREDTIRALVTVFGMTQQQAEAMVETVEQEVRL